MLGVRLSDGTYRTHVFTLTNGKFVETVHKGQLLAPTSIGLRQIGVARKKRGNWSEDFLVIGPKGQTLQAPDIDNETAELIKGYSRTKILYVGKSYIGVEDSSEGAAKDGSSPFGYRELRFYSVSKPTDSLPIDKVIEGSAATFTKAARTAYQKAAPALRAKLNPKPDLTNWALRFSSKGWQVIGRLGYLEEKDRLIYQEFTAEIPLPPGLAIKLGAKADSSAPDGRWSVLFEKGQVKMKAAGSASVENVVKLNGAEVVMTIWSK